MPSNYRSISNLSFLSKVLERVINRQTIAYLDEHHLLPESTICIQMRRFYGNIAIPGHLRFNRRKSVAVIVTRPICRI